ncbi:TPA: hypothetical protein QCO88_004957 [Bacillus cereus]|uniref:hypothetical protein n=1 Tax=Bacillus TaxID=1386 RepID=UPI000BFDDEC2|nr:hypothetical protein [Bacillus toyonensis]PHC38890.1 hypothetical protein COF09_23070 [Bacillus toyonensis]HDR3902306.1 hypothetical protein [Bacillus cereus]
MKKFLPVAFSLGAVALLGSMFEVGDIMYILQKNGYDIPSWAAESLATMTSVYGAQHYLIGLLGVTVPAWLAGAVVAAGAAGL